MEGVRNDYESIEMEGLKFTTQLAGLMVAQSSSDVPFIEDDKVKIDPYTVDVKTALDELQEWQKHQSKENGELNFPQFDFLVALTSYNLLIVNELKSKHIAGIVSSKNICKETIASIVEKMDFFATRSTISHEIGHSLGMSHDIDEENCKPGDNFIMTPSFVDYSEDVLQNSYQFSSCSLSHLKTKIDELDSFGGNCLTDKGLDFNKGNEKVTVLGLYPGQLYDLDDQCRMVYGPESLYCGGLLSDQEICKTISCYSQSECITEPLLKAMDGTSCSKGSWCLKGKCVSDDRAPRAPKNCTNGDDHRPMKRRITCEKVDSSPYLCSLQLYKDQCCATCVNGRSSNGGCEDTIEECPNLKPRDCYNKFYATTCCKTCKTLVKDSSDSNCLYGDKGVGCSELLPEVCHLNSRYCCQTCAKYSAAKSVPAAT